METTYCGVCGKETPTTVIYMEYKDKDKKEKIAVESCKICGWKK